MKTPRIRYGLITEVIVMAFDTVRTNKLRSGLTVLGVVIGITSIVAMTALIRGFDSSLQESLRTAMGPQTIFIQRFGITSFASGREFSELIKRPTLTMADALALEAGSTLELVDLIVGAGPGPLVNRRISYRDQKTRAMLVFGTGERYAEGTRIPIAAGRFFSGTEVQHRSRVAVLGYTAYQLLFQSRGVDPVGKTVRVGTDQFQVVGVFASRPSPGNFSLDQDDFVIIPNTTYQRVYGVQVAQNFRGTIRTPIMIAVVPRDAVTQIQAVEEIERIMRTRHDLRLDEPNDFDIVTQDALMRVWNQISQATFFALVVISSIALIASAAVVRRLSEQTSWVRWHSQRP
jgi:putative ABC transport system permease protein